VGETKTYGHCGGEFAVAGRFELREQLRDQAQALELVCTTPNNNKRIQNNYNSENEQPAQDESCKCYENRTNSPETKRSNDIKQTK